MQALIYALAAIGAFVVGRYIYWLVWEIGHAALYSTGHTICAVKGARRAGHKVKACRVLQHWLRETWSNLAGFGTVTSSTGSNWRWEPVFKCKTWDASQRKQPTD